MIPHRGFHRRFFNKRQAQLGGALGGLFPIPDPVGQSTSSVASQHLENDSSAGGVVGASTGASVPTPVSPTSSSTTSSTPLAYSSSSSTGSTTRSASSAPSARPISSTSPTTSTPTSSISIPTTPTPAPTPTLSVSDTVYASSDGTRVIYITSTLPATSATANPTTSFLQDPSLEGGIFALIGIVALIIVFVVVTWAVRKRRRNRLERDAAAAITFDPGATDHYKCEEDPVEKFRLSMSSSGHGYGYGYGLGIGPAYAPRQEYPGSVGYGQYPATGYPAPPVPYQAPSPAIPQPAAQGQEGANLKRKFSDRKPVPPLLPDPAHDPSMTRVSIPVQFAQQ